MAGALQDVGGDRATLEVIKTGDRIIDLIPAGGDGETVATGNPYDNTIVASQSLKNYDVQLFSVYMHDYAVSMRFSTHHGSRPRSSPWTLHPARRWVDPSEG
jgi:hypothetical protein